MIDRKKAAVKNRIRRFPPLRFLLNAWPIQTGTAESLKREVLEQFSPPPKTKALLDRTEEWNNPIVRNLTIITAVYNGESYIRECLESILFQETTYDYQVILVNDGSEDHSEQVISDLLHHPRLKYIQQKNMGLSRARNRAIEEIHSEYVLFVDADDHLAPGAIQLLLDIAYVKRCDVVQASFYMEYEGRKAPRLELVQEGKLYNTYSVPGYACGKLIHSKLFSEIKFPEDYLYEDSIMLHLLYPLSENIYCTDQLIYYCRIRPDSESRKQSPRALDSTWITELMVKERELLGLSNDERYLDFLIYQMLINERRQSCLPNRIKKQVFLLNCELAERVGKAIYPIQPFCRKLYETMQKRDYRSYRILADWIYI